MVNSQQPVKLNIVDYASIRSLFQGAYLTLTVNAVLAGNSTALIWADDPAQPNTALMWDNAHILYVVGEAGNHNFNQRLGEMFSTQLLPDARKRGIDGFKIVYGNPSWENQIATVFPTLPLSHYPRVVYSLGKLTVPDWQQRLAPSYSMRPIDQAMLNDKTLGNVADLVEEIESCWPSRERFLAQGFGLCLVGNDEIICRCTAEYVSPGKCGIGIATAEPYRRRGFATLTASAFLADCRTRGLTPYWDAWSRNVASVATAEKIGLRKIQEYRAYIGPLA